MDFSERTGAGGANRQGLLLCGKWQIGRLLGSGGMSAVYEAVHRNGHRVAIKLLNPELCLNTRARQRFLREGYIANRVGHPGAVTVLDDGSAEDGSVFLVMELLHGQTLGDRLRQQGPLPADEVLACAEQALEILAAAHANGIVHRDVKPDNLFLTTGRTLKLLDFGIASVRELSASHGATRSGAALGTPAFMAPEQARGRPDQIDARTDLWALGATMFTLLTGRHVHEAVSSNEVLIAAATVNARSLSDLCPALDAQVIELVDTALRFDPNDRWPDANAMQRALRAITMGRTLPLPAPSRVDGSYAPSGTTSPQPGASSGGDGVSVMTPGNVSGRWSARRRIALLTGAAAIFAVAWWWSSSPSVDRVAGVQGSATAPAVNMQAPSSTSLERGTAANRPATPSATVPSAFELTRSRLASPDAGSFSGASAARSPSPARAEVTQRRKAAPELRRRTGTAQVDVLDRRE